MTPVALRRVALAVSCGLLWAAAVTAMETLSQPTDTLPLDGLIGLVSSIGWTWVVNGICWALAALLVCDQPIYRQALLITPLALGITLVHPATWHLGLTIDLNGGGAHLLGNRLPPEGLFFHILWMNLFYGGLYLLAFTGARRARRSRQSLAELLSIRAVSEAKRQQSRLSDLRGQLQPGVLIHALETLAQDYANASPRAELLFDKLVRFLRTAMPTIREGHATLGSELALLESYASLRRQLDLNGGVMLSTVEDQADCLPFPPLCLLPLVDELGGCTDYRRPIGIRRWSEHGFAMLRIDIPTAPAENLAEKQDRAARRLRLELTALHGDDAALSISCRSGTSQLTIRLPAPTAVDEADPCAEAC